MYKHTFWNCTFFPNIYCYKVLNLNGPIRNLNKNHFQFFPILIPNCERYFMCSVYSLYSCSSHVFSVFVCVDDSPQAHTRVISPAQTHSTRQHRLQPLTREGPRRQDAKQRGPADGSAHGQTDTGVSPPAGNTGGSQTGSTQIRAGRRLETYTHIIVFFHIIWIFLHTK